jgi:hypothetical protein
MRTTRWLLAALACGFLAPPSAHAQTARGVNSVLERIQYQSDQFPGARPPRIDIRLLSIAGGQKLSPLRLPFPGLLIIEVRAGSVFAVVDGRRTQRRSGEFWSVPSGVELHLETADDMATLQVTVIGS